MGPEQDTFHRGDVCLKAGRHCDVDVASVDRKQVICLAKWRVSDLGRRVRWEIQISSGIRIAQEMCETMRGPGNCGEHVMRRSHLSLKSISTKILLQLSPFFFWTCVFFRSGSKPSAPSSCFLNSSILWTHCRIWDSLLCQYLPAFEHPMVPGI